MGSRNTPLSHRVSRVMVACLLAGVASGCTPRHTPEGDVTAAASNFLAALSKGDGARALSLTLSHSTDFPCASMVEDGQAPMISAPRVLEARVDGTTATADVTYGVAYSAAEVTLSFEKRGDEWLVVLPDSYQLVVEFEPAAVAVVTMSWSLTSEGAAPTCDVPVHDGRVAVPALPGLYGVKPTDPSQIVEGFPYMNAVVGGSALAPVGYGTLEYLDQFTATEWLSRKLAHHIVDCTTRFDEHPEWCGSDTEGLALMEEGYIDAFGEGPRWLPEVDKIWTEDDETWLFSTKPVHVRMSRDGKEFYLDRVYTGHLAITQDLPFPHAVFDDYPDFK